MTDKQLDEVLEELGREHRAIDAPDSLQRVLYAAAESSKSPVGKPRMQPAWTWAVVAILLAVAAVGVFWRTLQTRQPKSQRSQTQQARSIPLPEVSSAQLHSSPVTGPQSVEPKAASARKAAKVHPPVPSSPPDAATASSLDAFVPLPASEGLPNAAELSIVRIRLRASDLQQYGLQAPADALAQTMLAEFAVGEDGLPRAIRIVR